MSAEREQGVAVILPALGAEPVEFSVWFAEPGESVYEGDRIAEVCAGAATFDVASPATGRLASKLAEPRDVLRAGQVIGFVERSSG